MVIGWRIFDRPLHRRKYRLIAVPGALHPPVAGAISLLAGVSPRDRVFDPCCGSGTLLIEARRRSSVAGIIGMDIAPDRIAIALRNAENADVPLICLTGDAADIPLGDACIDLCVANMPWGKQVKAAGRLSTDPQAFWPELRRLLSDRGRAIILLDQQQAPPNWRCLGFHLNYQLSIATAGKWLSLYLISVDQKWGPWPPEEFGKLCGSGQQLPTNSIVR
jgi:23S rRNA G2445 N2-methylase RlmL